MEEGRFFSTEFATDSTNAFVINESAAKSMGMKNPINEVINVWGKDGRIIGVTKNFNFISFHSAIEPLIFRMPASQEYFYAYTTIFIRFQTSEPDELISFIEKKWKEVLPGTPFNYYFFDESLDASYKSEITMSAVFNYFSFISILIACLGLFGLASISAEQRRKEIGVRKVLGASISNVALILSKEFLIWVILSNIIAFPAAYYFMNTWLQDFAYRIEISWWMFALAGGIALVIALATVSFQAIKAATANPVESLRYE
jgi:putative ABC transport system permease protein